MVNLPDRSIVHDKDLFNVYLGQLVRSEAHLANALSLVEWYDLFFD